MECSLDMAVAEVTNTAARYIAKAQSKMSKCKSYPEKLKKDDETNDEITVPSHSLVQFALDCFAILDFPETEFEKTNSTAIEEATFVVNTNLQLKLK